MMNYLWSILLVGTLATLCHSYPADGDYISRRAVLLEDDLAPSEVVVDEEETPINENVRFKRHTRDDHVREKRGHKHHHGGPIYVNTYAMTDHHGHFKWGVKHNVGKY